MKRRIINSIVALMAMATAGNAQQLSVGTIEAVAGKQTEMTVSLTGATGKTALQYNLSLPAGLTLAETTGDYGIKLGNATKGHTLSVSPLASGDLLIVLYSMYQDTFADGTLMTLPVVASSEAGTTSGSLNTIRTATADAVSSKCADVAFSADLAAAYTEVANIADVKKLENGTEFKLTLKDAKVTVQTFSMRGMMILLEDATGAIDVSELSALEGFVEQNVINGTLYGVYRNEFGTIGLGLSENTEKSEITVQPGVVTPTKFTIADVKNEANYYKFVELNDCKAVQDESYTWWAFTGTDSIAITDRFNKAVNWDTGEMEIPANIKSMTGIVMFDGEKWVICPYAYGEDKAIIAVEEPKPTEPVVKMTWVDYDQPAVAMGEIAAGETARAGYNKISGGSVAFANTGWGENKITYIEVDASCYTGNIIGATLKVDVSGSTDGKRTTGWGVGYNSSKWSADMTYETADKTITTMGDLIWTSTKSASTFETKEFNIVDAFKNDDDNIVTLLVYETAAAGGYIKNPQVSFTVVNPEDQTTYTVVSVDANANAIRTSVYDAVVGATATATAEEMAAFKNEDASKKYIYVGGNSEITLVKDSASNVITLNFREAETYRYSVVAVDGEGNQIQTLSTNSDFEGETVYAPYQRYILNYADSTLYEASATNKEYRKQLALNEDGAKLNVTYNQTTIKNVVAYQEGEDVWGLTPTTAGNTPVRSSNAAAAYAEEDVELTYLSTGLYKMAVGFANSKSSSEVTFNFALDTDTLFGMTSTGINMTVVASEEFQVLGNGVPLKVLKGGNDTQALDFFYIQKTGSVPSVVVEDIVVNVTEGEISAAVEAEKAKVAKVGKITVNLTEGVEYTLASPIVAGAGGIVINGNKSVITTSSELITLPAEPTVTANEAKAGFFEITSPIVIENVHVKAAKAIVKSKAKYLVSAININNSIIEMTAQSAVVDFSGGQMGYPTVLSVNNSTVWSAQSTNKPFFTSQSGNSPKDINNAAEEKQTISIENSTFYNVAYNKNFNELRQKGQKFLVFTIKNNIIVNSGKANFLQGMDGGQSSANPTWTVENNTFGTLVDGAFTDVSASQTGCGEVVNSVVTNPGFKDVAAGDFTVYAGSEQAKQKIGDPRWLVEFDETLTGIDGINAAETLNGAVYTINGIKVREAGETLKGLSKGMYIINGKKVVVGNR